MRPEGVDTDRSVKTSCAEKPAGAFEYLIPPIQQAIAAEGYVNPTPIQEQGIPPALTGRDILGCAQTGTGKTAAFMLPLLQRLYEQKSAHPSTYPRALILAPTRELAAQIADSATTYGRKLSIRHTVIFGGVSQHHQVTSLKRGTDIIIATPGRLLDLMNQGYVRLEHISIFVLDEVDRMLDMGFIPDIQRILKTVPAKRQTLFFSATMTGKPLELAQQMLTDPVKISIAPDKPAVDRIKQRLLFVKKENKAPLLADLLKNPDKQKVLVFTQMKHMANRVTDKLNAVGIHSTAIHGNKSQSARTKALKGFQEGRFRVLVATDVAARGLDVDDITHVINYDIPMEAETYVHRIGRTARAGAEGASVTFCCNEDWELLHNVEKLLGRPIPVDALHTFHCETTQNNRNNKTGGSINRQGQRGGHYGARRSRSQPSFRKRRA